METEQRSKSWRWVGQGVIVGGLIALLGFTTVAWLRDDPIRPVTTAYKAKAVTIGPHELLMTMRDYRQPAAVPSLPGMGGDRYISLTGVFEYGVDQSAPALQFSELDLVIHAVDDTGTRREELVPTAKAQRTLDGLTGYAEPGDPFWLRLSYEPPSGIPDHYLIDLRIGDEQRTLLVKQGD